MIKNKKTSSFTHIFALTLFLFPPIKCANQLFQSYTPFEFFEDDTTEFDESFSDYLATRSCVIEPEVVLDALTSDPINIQDLVQKNLYKRTNPSITRPIIELPFFQKSSPQHAYLTNQESESKITCALFWNQTAEKYYYKDFEAIRDYLGVFDNDFIELFEQLSQKLAPDTREISVATILTLFSNIKLEERRAGTVFSWSQRRKNYRMQAQIPLYFIEHNFMLTEKEQNDIKDEPFIKDFTRDQPAQDPNAVNKAIQEHVSEDLLGFGDLKLLFLLEQRCGNLTLAFGPEIIFPSACILTDRLIGGHFEKTPKQPSINFLQFACGLSDGSLGQKEIDTAKDFGIGIIDRLTQIVGNTNLGQGYLSGYGRLEAEYAITDSFKHTHLFRLGGGTSYYTTRFFNEIKDPRDFDRDYTIESDVAKNLCFLQDQLVSSVYPIPRTVRITPGPRFEYRGSLQKQHWAGNLEVGYDFWFQGADQVSLKQTHSQYFSLNSPIAKPSNAFENKLFATLFWSKERNDHYWSIALFGDYTFSSSGTGNDWTAGFSANVHW